MSANAFRFERDAVCNNLVTDVSIFIIGHNATKYRDMRKLNAVSDETRYTDFVQYRSDDNYDVQGFRLCLGR